MFTNTAPFYAYLRLTNNVVTKILTIALNSKLITKFKIVNNPMNLVNEWSIVCSAFVN